MLFKRLNVLFAGLFVLLLNTPANARIIWVRGTTKEGARLAWLTHYPVSYDMSTGLTRFHYGITDKEGYREWSAYTPWCMQGKLKLDPRYNPSFYKSPSWWVEFGGEDILINADSKVSLELLKVVCKLANEE